MTFSPRCDDLDGRVGSVATTVLVHHSVAVAVLRPLPRAPCPIRARRAGAGNARVQIETLIPTAVRGSTAGADIPVETVVEEHRSAASALLVRPLAVAGVGGLDVLAVEVGAFGNGRVGVLGPRDIEAVALDAAVNCAIHSMPATLTSTGMSGTIYDAFPTVRAGAAVAS